ncbi:MAG: hypothetical protein M3Y69_02630, partial [Verrucomicrobiota bacterium]|nr:hypothetical protein [Verrucomicrobiota bacterium]
LTLSGTPADWSGKQVKVQISWLSPSTDYDLFIHKGSVTGPLVSSSATGTNTLEVANIDPNGGAGTGVFVVHVVYFAAVLADQYTGVASIIPAAVPTPTPTPGGSPTPTPQPSGAPKFANYQAPAPLGRGAGEPSIGSNWKTGNVMFQAGLETLRVSFNDCTSPAKATWLLKNGPNTSTETLDPILFVDSVNGRTFVDQLAGKASLLAFTDDDGETYTVSSSGGMIGTSGVDHQTIGAGPFRPNSPVGPVTAYPNAVYYASQDIGTAEASLSRDGGLTFTGNGASTPMYTAADCGGLHGHLKVAPDGTVYVPNKGCTGQQAAAVSTDGGLTFTVRRVPGSTPGESDPSIGVGTNGVGKPGTNLEGTNTIYFGYSNGDGHPRIAVSRDRGVTWTDDQDVGVSFGIKNTVFPQVVAGDDNRAGFAFLGTTTPGAAATGADPAAFNGFWHLYVATTYDGGKTWVTTDATPNDPVQRGIICTQGTTCASGRNLLDFMDNQIDKQGRQLVGYADGCVDDCVAGGGNSGTAVATIARQSGGKTLFASNDPAAAKVPGTPLTKAVLTSGTTVRLTWQAPDDGGSPITAYNIYRGSENGAEPLLATVGASTLTFDDNSGSAIFFYRVTAVNAVGESAKCDRVSPQALLAQQSPCTVPGRTVADDAAGDQVGAPANRDLDILNVAVAEPYFADGSKKLVFTMKVADLSVLVPNRQYRFIYAPKTPPTDGVTDRYYIGMNTNAGGDPTACTYVYGELTATGNAAVMSGNADSGSVEQGSGIIRVTISNSKVGSPKAGDTLSGFNARTFAGNGDGNQSQASSVDFTGSGAYNLVGNAFCQNPPTTAAPVVARLLNISTRANVKGGDNVLIGGFIIDGTAPRQIVLRAIGPSLKANGQPVPGRLDDPTLQLFDQNNAIVAENDNWKDSQQREIEATGLQPTDDRESTIVRTLIPGVYTAVLNRKGAATGIGVVEAYDPGAASDSKFANLSSRGFVETGDNVMIGGSIVGGGTTGPVHVVVRALGPSLSKSNVPNTLQDPKLELRDANGVVIRSNDNWMTDQQAEIEKTGLAPTDSRESAIVASMPLGLFTAIVSGNGPTPTGVGLVEIYNIP